MSNPIDTRNLATTSIRRVNARTDREDLSGEGRTDHTPKKTGHDQPIAFDEHLSSANREDEAALQQLNFAVSLLEALLSRTDDLLALTKETGGLDSLSAILQPPLFQHYTLPISTENKPSLVPIRVEAGFAAEPYSITLYPVDTDQLLRGDLKGLEQARAEYLRHHEWAHQTLLSRIQAHDVEAIEDPNAFATELSEALADCGEAPWASGRIKNATRLLRSSPQS